jgi:hypothetical protein
LSLHVNSRRIARIERLLDGTVKIVVENVKPGERWILQRTGVLPAVMWDSLEIQQSPAGGVMEFIDPAPLPGAAFYRLDWP